MELTTEETRAVRLLLQDECYASGRRRIAGRVVESLNAKGFRIQTERPLHEGTIYYAMDKNHFAKLAETCGITK